MDKFTQAANIAHYNDLLKIEADPAKRKVLQELLRDEKNGWPSRMKPAAKSPGRTQPS
jgi:hypothetical protein